MLIIPQYVRRGRRVEVLILGERSVVSFRVKGRVRWIDEDRNRRGQACYLVGIEFDPLQTGARNHLARLMAEPRPKTSRRSNAPISARWDPPRPSSRRVQPVRESGRMPP